VLAVTQFLVREAVSEPESAIVKPKKADSAPETHLLCAPANHLLAIYACSCCSQSSPRGIR